jgi:hypothetical protein
VLFENDHVDAGTGKQEAEHHAGGATTGDTAARREGLHEPSLASEGWEKQPG